MPRIRVAACQIDTVVGDIPGNVRRVLAWLDRAEDAGADLAVFPELCITGYPPEDLVLKAGFVADAAAGAEEVIAAARRSVALFGFADPTAAPAPTEGGTSEPGEPAPPEPGERPSGAGARGGITPPTPIAYNAAAIAADGQRFGVYRKRHLPTYAVFDEARTFRPGEDPISLYLVAGVPIGVAICEDAWIPGGPVEQAAAAGARLSVVLNASPFFAGRAAARAAVMAERTSVTGCPLVYVNAVGGQDELVFDGGTFVVGPDGALVASAPQFSEHLLVVDLDVPDAAEARSSTEPVARIAITGRARPNPEPAQTSVVPFLDPDEETYEALVTGTRAYVEKNGFESVLIGLSGGIDSSLVAVIAVDALGSARVRGVAMPSRYSSAASVDDAVALALALGIDLLEVPIEAAHAALESMLRAALGAPLAGVAAENLQSRIRGVVLMALSNATGALVLTTGNKSELAVGYSTLYGDTAGGFAVVKDVPKTQVYRLARLRNARGSEPVIPESVLAKPPSAELRPEQRDDQSLPPYDVLDPALHAYVELDHTEPELITVDALDAELAARVACLVDGAEYKRRQNPIGVRVTPKSFGKDRRVPITSRYRPGTTAS